ncbi:MAG: TM2 domain-containing protein [Candidatus Kapabacteria bacterium]|nr:TM2 domain-containing protein [Candidatus Kapabacteria bacterium]
MANVLQYIPDADGEEISYLNMIISPMSDEQAMQFAMMYRSRRKEPQMILILAIVGFIGIAGIHRFVIGNIGLGILYVLTGGLCWIGTIVDIVNYRKLAAEYNQQQAYEVANIMRSMGQL